MADLASEVRTELEAQQIRRIPSGAILAMAMVLVAEMGPIGSTVLATEFSEWQATYGSFVAAADAVPCVQGFFEGGGTRLYTSRVVHTSSLGDPTTKASVKGSLTLNTAVASETGGTVLSSVSSPYAFVNGDTLVVSVTGGGDLTATFTGAAAARTSGNAQPFVLVNGDTLTIAVDGGAPQAIAFLTAEFVAIGAATALEVAAVINAKITGAKATVSAGAVVITSDRKGTGSGINITAGGAQAAGKLNYTAGLISGTGNVSNLAAVTSAEFETVVEAAVAGVAVTAESGFQRITTTATGAGVSVQVKVSSTLDTVVGFDNAVHSGNAAGAQGTIRVDGKWDGAYANVLKAIVGAPTSGAATDFNLTIQKSGVTVESWPNLNMDATSPRYALTIVNAAGTGSRLVTLVNLSSSLASPANLPTAGTFGPLTAGNDGLVGLTDTDFTGGKTVNGSTGLRVLDAKDIDVVAVPGRATSAVHNGVITYCEIVREGLCFAILDPPAASTAEQMVTYVTTTAGLFGLTEIAAIYWPRVQVVNPDKGVYGSTLKNITIAPSGHIAGLYARTDARKVGGAFEQPAGTERGILANVVGLETEEVLEKPKRELVFPKNINPISKEEGPIFVDGARNLKLTGSWPSVGQRRGVMFIEKRLRPGLAFMRHQNIKARLRTDGRNTVLKFLGELCTEKCFKTDDPKKAFFVDFGPGLNTAAVEAARKVKARIGLATSEPAEFIHVLIGPDNRELEKELAALAA